MTMALILVMITAIQTIATGMLFLIPPDFHLLLEKMSLLSRAATIALLSRRTWLQITIMVMVSKLLSLMMNF